MELFVDSALEQRGFITDFKNVSLDEKAYAKGHQYASILIDTDNDRVLNLVEGRKGKSVQALFFELNEEEKQSQLERVNIDMWKPYMDIMKEIAPQAVQVHDKFHLSQKLSDAIDKTRKKEIREGEDIEKQLLAKQKYTVLKNTENRTKQQQEQFDKILKANLKTAQVWGFKEMFKNLFSMNWEDKVKAFEDWLEKALASDLMFLKRVAETFKKHKEGIVNALLTDTTSSKHENTNGKIQSIIAKARGFLNFDRFKVNVMFYFRHLS